MAATHCETGWPVACCRVLSDLKYLEKMLIEYFTGCIVVQDFAGNIVDLMHNIIDGLLGHEAKIGTFGKVAAQEAIGILIRAPLPGRVRVSKVCLYCQVVSQFRMQHVFTPIIDGCCFSCLLRQHAKDIHLRKIGFLRADAGNLLSKKHTGDPLYFRMDACLVFVPNNRISFPMPKLSPRVNGIRPLPNGNPVWNFG